MNAVDLIELRYDAVHDSYANLLRRMSDGDVRTQPHGLNSIAWLAWLAWHVARIEDATINGFVAGRPQVLTSGRWNERLGIDRTDVGSGMTSDEVRSLSQAIDLAALAGYLSAVAASSKTLLAEFGPADLDRIVDRARVHAAIEADRLLLPAGASVGEFWAVGHPVGWFLLQTALLHPSGHLYDVLTVKGLLAF